MRILFLGNNWLGWHVLEWLKQQEDEVVGLVVHPTGRQQYTEQILEAGGLPSHSVFDGSKLREESTLAAIRALNADIALSVLFGYILEPSIIGLFPQGVINLHPALLPFNRGAHPNVWSIIEGTPAGATVHYIDEGIDAGDIIAQRRVQVEPIDTGETLYRKLEAASLSLIIEAWPLIRQGNPPRKAQVLERGTYHRKMDVEEVDRIDLDSRYTARKLIDILRARTFHPYSGAYFEESGRKVYVSVSLDYAEDLASER